ncbi:riboflavin kinase domain-containing protein [Ditylenchus destructor]|uniref:riboflavin kinase n=1 Tax=Ditylenchus destructor TaxID=166010 RepID=A0AAD4RA50_9BILA|nr:riboflavin kinase domain-containing protein [Ditylenchus destructor]
MTLSSPKGPLAEVASRFLPHFFRGRVVHGYGRGGKKLNCPTANLESSTVTSLPNDFPNGVYAGFARVEKTDLQPMVMSVGFNPHFGNEKKTLEVHILKEFNEDFYDKMVEAVALSFIRPLESYSSLAELINAIETDKSIARSTMTDGQKTEVEKHKFFSADA